MARFKSRPVTQRMALGAAAGIGATLALQVMMMAQDKLLPDSKPPIKQDPGEFMVGKAEQLVSEETREKIPPLAHTAAAKSLHLGYGMTSGALYGLIRAGRGSILVDGPLLGVGVWAAGYLGWLPATKLMPPITEHEPQQIAAPIVEHALYGVCLAAAYDALMRV